MHYLPWATQTTAIRTKRSFMLAVCCFSTQWLVIHPQTLHCLLEATKFTPSPYLQLTATLSRNYSRFAFQGSPFTYKSQLQNKTSCNSYNIKANLQGNRVGGVKLKLNAWLYIKSCLTICSYKETLTTGTPETSVTNQKVLIN